MDNDPGHNPKVPDSDPITDGAANNDALDKAIDAADAERATSTGQDQPAEPGNSPSVPDANNKDSAGEKATAFTPYDMTRSPTASSGGTVKVTASVTEPKPKSGVRRLRERVPSGVKADQDTPQSPAIPSPPPGPTPKPLPGNQGIAPPPSPPGGRRVVGIGSRGPRADDSPPPPPPPPTPPKDADPKTPGSHILPPPPQPPAPGPAPSAVNPSRSSGATPGLTPHDPGSSRFSGTGLRPWEKKGLIAPPAPAPSQGAPNPASAPAPPPTGSVIPPSAIPPRQRPLTQPPPAVPPPTGNLNRGGAPSQGPNTPPSQTQNAVHNAPTLVQNADPGIPQLSPDLATRTISITEFTGPAPGDRDTPPSDAELHLAAEYLFQGENGQDNLRAYKQIHENYVKLATKHERGLGMGAISGGFRKMLKMGAPTRKEVLEAGNVYDEARLEISEMLADTLLQAGYSHKQAQAAVRKHDEFQVSLTGDGMRTEAESRARVEYTDPNQKPGFIGMRRAKYYQSYMKAGKIKKAAMVGAIGVPIGVGAALVTPAVGAAAAVAGVVGASRFAKGILGAKVNSEVGAVTRAEDRRIHREGISRQLIDSQYAGRTGNAGDELYKPASSITEAFSAGVIEAANKNRKHTIFRLGAIAAFGSAGAAAADYLSDNSGEISNIYNSTVGDVFGGGDGKSSATINTEDLSDLGDTFDNLSEKSLGLTDQEAEAQAADASAPEASAENSFGDKERHFQRTGFNNSLFGLSGDENGANRIQLHQTGGNMVTLREFNGDDIVELELDPDGGFTDEAKNKLEDKGFKLIPVEAGDSKSPNGRWDIVDERTDAQRGSSQDNSSDSAPQTGDSSSAHAGNDSQTGAADQESAGTSTADQGEGLTGTADSGAVSTGSIASDGLTGGTINETGTSIGRGSGLTGGTSFSRPDTDGLSGTVSKLTPEQIRLIEEHERNLRARIEEEAAKGLVGTAGSR